MARWVGVDVGTTAVRVVEVSGTDDTSAALVSRATVVELIPGAVVGGKIKDPAAVAFAMKQAFEQSKIPRYGAVMGVSSPEGVVTRIALPAAVKPSEWATVLRTADRDISPLLRISDAAVSITPMKSVPSPGEGKVMTLLGAVPRSDVQTLLRTARMAKATPRAVDMVGTAVTRCMTRTYPSNADVATVVDVGAGKVTVATRQGLYLRSVRTVPVGADDITRAVMGALDCTYVQAEAYKKASRVDAASAPSIAMPGEDTAAVTSAYGLVSTGQQKVEKSVEQRVADSVAVAAASLADEIASCVEADSAKFSTNTTKSLVLCGGGALLKGMRALVAERVGVPVMVGRPWASLVPGKHTEGVLASAGGEELALLELATGIGLALWGRK